MASISAGLMAKVVAASCRWFSFLTVFRKVVRERAAMSIVLGRGGGESFGFSGEGQAIRGWPGSVVGWLCCRGGFWGWCRGHWSNGITVLVGFSKQSLILVLIVFGTLSGAETKGIPALSAGNGEKDTVQFRHSIGDPWPAGMNVMRLKHAGCRGWE